MLKVIIINKSKWKYYTIIGTSGYFTFKESYKHHTSKEVYEPEISFVNSYFGILNFKTGIEHKLSNKLNVRYGPNIKLSLTDVGLNHRILHTIGLEVNLFYNINKSKVENKN